MNSFNNQGAELYAVIGMNYQSAPIGLREKISFSDSTLNLALLEAKNALKIEEIAIISTCNRTEIYIADNNAKEKIDHVIKWLRNFHKIDADTNLQNYLYIYSGIDAIKQIMKVASGVDSMVFGESQILGQLKKSYNIAIEASTLGTHLHYLFQKCFAISKIVRSQTAVGDHPVSVAYVVNKLATKIFADIKTCSALLVGAGETIKLIAKYLTQHNLNKIFIANRTLANATAIAETIDASAVSLDKIPELLKDFDIIITSTANQNTIITKQMLAQAVKYRKHKPIFIVDIAVPRDVDPVAAEISDVFLYTIDDLHGLLDKNLKLRKQATADALEIIEKGAADILNRLKSLHAVNILQDYRQNTTEICKQELKIATQKLSDGIPSELVLESFAHTLANKLMHHPSIEIKRAALEGDATKLDWAKNLLGLDS